MAKEKSRIFYSPHKSLEVHLGNEKPGHKGIIAKFSDGQYIAKTASESSVNEDELPLLENDSALNSRYFDQVTWAKRAKDSLSKNEAAALKDLETGHLDEIASKDAVIEELKAKLEGRPSPSAKR